MKGRYYAANRYQFSGKIPEKEDNDTMMTDAEKKDLADKVVAKVATTTFSSVVNKILLTTSNWSIKLVY